MKNNLLGVMKKKKKNNNNNNLLVFLVMIIMMISAALLSTSVAAGKRTRFLTRLDHDGDYINPPKTYTEDITDVEASSNVHDQHHDLHERLLNDYPNYDPAPALRKPPSMIINN